MRDKIIEVLNDIDEEIILYTGENLVEDGLVDSFTIIEILTEIEERLNITISKDDVTAENFKSIESICKMLEKSYKI